MIKNHGRKGRNAGRTISKAIVFVIGILSIAVVLVIVVFMLYQDLSRRIYHERRTRLNEIANRTGRVMEIDIDRGWKSTEKGIQVWKDGSLSNKADMLSVSAATDSAIGDSAVFLAIDQEGGYYSSDGQQGKWEAMDKLTDAFGDRQLLMVNFQQNHASLVFLVRLSEAVVVEDVTITHFAMVEDADRLKWVFFQSEEQDYNPVYVITKEGIALYQQGEQLYTAHNLLQTLKREEFLYNGSAEKLQKNIMEQQPDSMEFTHNGTRYFVSCVPVHGSEWNLLLFVQSDRLGYGGNQLLRTVAASFVGLVLAVLFLTAYMIYMLVHLRRSRKLVKKQSKANVILAKTAEEAKVANAAKSIFLSHMSHDIRTPINGIIGMTDIALREIDNEERLRYCLRTIAESSRHLISLVNDVLDISRIEQGKMTVSQDSIDIEILMENCESIICGQLMRRRINFEKQLVNILHPRVIGDGLHLRQLLVNILGNAVKYTLEGGMIQFIVREVAEEADTVRFRFEIKDNGVGMSEEFQQRIFEAFAQEDSCEDSQGTGLGMYITKQFVDLLNGTIEVESQPDKGSLFVVELSMLIDYSQPEAAAAEEQKSLEAMKVLVVEDNPLNMEIARCILEEEKVEVLAAVNGKEAVECFEQSECYDIDLILMDVVMPVMDGITATRCIRRMSRMDAQSVPIIAMTANAYTEDVQMVLDAGMNMHIAKPVEVSQLIKLLSRYKK